MARGSDFIQGLVVGTVGGLLAGTVLIYALDVSGVTTFAALRVPDVQHSLAWVYRNLGFSLPVFGLILLLFVQSLSQLRRQLRDDGPLDEVAHTEHLTDTWTSLFFGVGVIWTAIGMRSALIYALGEPDNTINDGAFAVLQRMVNGGILLALSTTIFGGIGGYLMRIVKTVTVGSDLKRYYDRVSQQPSNSIQATLSDIKHHLASLAGHSSSTEASRTDEATLGQTNFPHRV